MALLQSATVLGYGRLLLSHAQVLLPLALRLAVTCPQAGLPVQVGPCQLLSFQNLQSVCSSGVLWAEVQLLAHLAGHAGCLDAEASMEMLPQGAHLLDDLYCAMAAQGLPPPTAVRRSVRHWSWGDCLESPLVQAALRKAVLLRVRFDLVRHPAGPARIACLQAG